VLSYRGVLVVRFRGRAGDLDALYAYMNSVQVRALADSDGMVTLALMYKPRSRLHENSELTGYVTTWNALNPYQELQIVETLR
jgi:hypothetical protein